MNVAVAEDERRREIVRHFLCAKVGEDGKIVGTVRVSELAPDGLTRLIDTGDRTIAEQLGFEEFVGGLGDLDLGIRAPE